MVKFNYKLTIRWIILNNDDINDVVEEIDKFYKSVSDNVKKFRKQNKLSQLEFSQKVGFNNVSFYCDCENNKNGKHFNLLHVVRIAKFLNIDLNELVKY